MSLSKNYCVIDNNNKYVDLVAVDIDDNGTVTNVHYYTLQENETLIDTQPPMKKRYANSDGFIIPVWNGSEWVEGATDEEIAEFAIEHPALEAEVNPEPTAEEMLNAMLGVTSYE